MKFRRVLALLLACAMTLALPALAAQTMEEDPDVSLYVDSVAGRATLSIRQSNSEDHDYKVQCLWPSGAAEYYFYDLDADLDPDATQNADLALTYEGQVYVNGVEKRTSSGTLVFNSQGETVTRLTWQEDGEEEPYTFTYWKNCTPSENPVVMVVPSVFDDVDATAYYSRAVNWVSEMEITTGRGKNQYVPDATVTRAEAVTFLWRMAGKPQPTQTQTFADVENDPNKVWYETAVQWAVEQGITNGTGSGFSPTVTCDRGMILTMLYRMEGRPWDEALAAQVPDEAENWTLDDFSNAIVQAFVEALRGEENSFSDVKEGAYYEIPVIWASLNGILDENQVDLNTRAVGPTAPCYRGEMAYFLYRAGEYEQALREAQESYDQWNTPLEPIEVGTIEETTVMDEQGVKITADSIEYVGGTDDVLLRMTVTNSSDKTLSVDVWESQVNTYMVSTSTSIPVEEEGFTTYESVIVPAGESRQFVTSLNYLRDNGISAVREIRLRMTTYVVTPNGEGGYDYEAFADGEAVTIPTSLYDESVSYDQEGTPIYDDGTLQVLITQAEYDEILGPQITVYAYNRGAEPIYLELVELKLDGQDYESYCYLELPAGMRNIETVGIDYDYENVPVAQEAQLTFCKLDPDTWEAVSTFGPVPVALKAAE